MRKKTLAAFAAAVLAAGSLAGCSGNTEDNKESNGERETAAEASSEASSEESTQAEPSVLADADIVIAGGDPAGMAAAIQAVAEGTDPAKILVLGSGESAEGESMNAAATDEQSDAGIEDSVDGYIEDTMNAGGQKNSQEMVEHLAEESRDAVSWVKELGVELTGVTQEEGSSVARSYQAADGGSLGDELSEKIKEKFQTLNVSLDEDAVLTQVLYGADGEVTGVKIEADGEEQEITCRALLVTDAGYIDLLKDLAVTYVTDESGANAGIVVDSCANAVTADDGEIPGLYAAGRAIDAALHGSAPLMGNELTGLVVFGTTAGTETAIYAQDNAPEE